MTPAQELELFAQLRGLPRFAEWLEFEEAKVVGVLVFNTTPAHIHQAQGAAQLLGRMKKMLVSAHIEPRHRNTR